MNLKSAWLKHGFWNMLEHGITRGSDAVASLVLLWALSPETFSKLASSQAIVAPVLLLFVAPETVIYRDYALWKESGPSLLAARLNALRKFAWGKGQLALVLSAGLACFSSGPWSERFWPLVWAFSLALGPQISGPDREYLRLDLKLKTLNIISLYQKLSLLIGTCVIAFLMPGRLDALALVAAFTAVSTAWVASSKVKSTLREEGASSGSLSGVEGPDVLTTLKECLTRFSLWQHANGVLQGWVQTMDLFVLTVLRLPAREVGLYAAVLKIGNFSLMIPIALINIFMIWLGRNRPQDGHRNETSKLTKYTIWLAVGAVFQGLVIYLVSPLIFKALSHGRWSDVEQEQMQHWLAGILIGAAIFCAAFLPTSWFMLRSRIFELFYKVFLPWAGISFVIYYVAIHNLGGSAFQNAANANIVVSVVFVGLILLYRRIRTVN